jgi:hypothetical protein
MPRNDQVTRQWFLLQALEKPGGATIEELAQSVPNDYLGMPGNSNILHIFEEGETHLRVNYICPSKLRQRCLPMISDRFYVPGILTPSLRMYCS